MILEMLIIIVLEIVYFVLSILSLKKQQILIKNLLSQNTRLLEEKQHFLKKKSNVLNIIDDAKRHKENYFETVRKIEKELYNR